MSVNRPEILVGLGANLPAPGYAGPRETLEAALAALTREGVALVARSGWWESAPVPLSDQPWYVNGVASVATALGPKALLALLHRIEDGFGRVRRVRNEARALDLDLLAYGSLVRRGPEPPILPHPRMAERAFVLLPLAEILPDWCHPETGRSVRELIQSLPPGQLCRPLGTTRQDRTGQP